MLVIKAISFNKAAIVSANSNNSRTQFLGMTKNEALKRLGNINLPGNQPNEDQQFRQHFFSEYKNQPITNKNL